MNDVPPQVQEHNLHDPLSKECRIIFAGTPDFAAICLKALVESGHNIVSVYTQPDRPAGRGKKQQWSPVKSLALEHDLPIEQPETLKSETIQATLQAYQADLMIVVAYGLLIPEKVLNIPRLGCINVHASLLPRWRGAAPIQRAIEAGDAHTGVCIMQMDKGLDTGPVWSSHSIPIDAQDTGNSLHDKLAKLGAEALLKQLPIIAAATQKPRAQSNDNTCYAHKLNKSDALINWKTPARDIERKIRAFNSWPVAFFHIEDNPVRVWQAQLIDAEDTAAPAGHILQTSKDGIDVACSPGRLRLTELQPPGSRRMHVQDLLNSKSHWFEVGRSLLPS